MFETPSKDIDDTTPLLPTYRGERRDRPKRSSYSTTAVLVAIACLVSLGLLAIVALSTQGIAGMTSLQEEGGAQEPICDPSSGTQCLKRVLGYCVQQEPCIEQPTSAPSSFPTPKPTTVDDCDPENPPCANLVLGICFSHHVCGSSATSSSSPTNYPTSVPTNLLTCNPEHPPCINRVLGICWEFAHCGPVPESVAPTSVPTPKPSTTTDCNPEAPPCEKQVLGFCYKYFDCAAPGNHNSYPQKPLFPGFGGESDENTTSVSPSPAPGGTDAPTIESIFGGSSSSSPEPTFKPTTKHNCDPKNPPCNTYLLGICMKYEKCYGIDSTPANATWDDDGEGTSEPTPMPLPDPTPVPTFYPSSAPSTSAPSVKGYTPSPTISMKPTAAETFGPTQLNLCDPQKPPCDNYFFGVCLGVRHCLGSHEPTPAPTPNPTIATDYPTSSPTTSFPTPVPSLATSEPTEQGETYTPSAAATTVPPTVTVSIIVPDLPKNPTFAPSPLPTMEPTDVPVVPPTAEPIADPTQAPVLPIIAAFTPTYFPTEGPNVTVTISDANTTEVSSGGGEESADASAIAVLAEAISGHGKTEDDKTVSALIQKKLNELAKRKSKRI